ncbi:hypothetical protein PILCRDRAFT_800361 [Piloderma croceum F 1598]|uniref:Uncharacterized protein n=1 Tax=Piloderma croceum (strain F 1598) TaxID=765440 RepID=A0A0C3F4A9_PILCF|nr:hypothetical protein PILCRDRAFT_800361 [Piloderma croceum F 1598]
MQQHQAVADARIAAARVQAEFMRSSHRQTHALPNEILAAIFEAGSFEEWSRQKTFSVTVSHSRRWRNIALHTPAVWSTIFMKMAPGLRQIDAYLERSRACSLDIRMSVSYVEWFSRDFKEERELFARVLVHADRWAWLTVTMPDNRQLSSLIGPLRNVQFPRLESISIRSTHNYGDEGMDLAIFECGTPVLSSLCVSGVAMPQCLPLAIALTSLDLGWMPHPLSHDNFRQMVLASPLLRNLSLYGEAVDFSSHRTIEIPSLRSLRIRGFSGEVGHFACRVSGPVKSLRMPVLRSLVLVEAWGQFMSDLVQACRLHDGFPTLQFLDISSTEISYVDAYFLITSMTGIVHVSLPGRKILDHSHTHSVLRQLSKKHSHGMDLWPRLRTITINEIDILGGQILLDVIQQRIARRQPIDLVRSSSFRTILVFDFHWLGDHKRTLYFTLFKFKPRSILTPVNDMPLDLPLQPDQNVDLSYDGSMSVMLRRETRQCGQCHEVSLSGSNKQKLFEFQQSVTSSVSLLVNDI